MEKISYIRENIYGSVWDFTADMSVSDTAYSNIALQVHTDGSYFKDPPGYLKLLLEIFTYINNIDFKCFIYIILMELEDKL